MIAAYFAVKKIEITMLIYSVIKSNTAAFCEIASIAYRRLSTVIFFSIQNFI